MHVFIARVNKNGEIATWNKTENSYPLEYTSSGKSRCVKNRVIYNQLHYYLS